MARKDKAAVRRSRSSRKRKEGSKEARKDRRTDGGREGGKEGRKEEWHDKIKTPSPGRWGTTQWGNENHWDHFWRRVTYKKMDR